MKASHVRLIDGRLAFYDATNTPLGTFVRTNAAAANENGSPPLCCPKSPMD